MKKNKYLMILACLLLLLFSGANVMAAEDYIKNIEVGEAEIKFSATEFPRMAYLYMDLKNDGDKTISNLTFEISYYDDEGFQIYKAVVKNALIEEVLPSETKKCKIRLKGRGFNDKADQYPYLYKYKVGDFEIKILNVQFARK